MEALVACPACYSYYNTISRSLLIEDYNKSKYARQNPQSKETLSLPQSTNACSSRLIPASNHIGRCSSACFDIFSAQRRKMTIPFRTNEISAEKINPGKVRHPRRKIISWTSSFFKPEEVPERDRPPKEFPVSCHSEAPISF